MKENVGKTRRAVWWTAFGFLAAALMGFGRVAVPALYYSSTRLSLSDEGVTLIGAPDLFFADGIRILFPLVFLAAGVVFCGIAAARGSRRWGIPALVLCLGAGIGYYLLPSSARTVAVYTGYRFFFGMNGIPLAERGPWLFPLYRGTFLIGAALLLAAVCLAGRRRTRKGARETGCL